MRVAKWTDVSKGRLWCGHATYQTAEKGNFERSPSHFDALQNAPRDCYCIAKPVTYKHIAMCPRHNIANISDVF